jgi:superfamily II DNA or RNA helicase
MSDFKVNKLEGKTEVSESEYLEAYIDQITQESEKLFVKDFLFPILGDKEMTRVIPQYPFIDSEGRSRRIDFALLTDDGKKLAFEIDGAVYHAEGAISSKAFDDSLFRQNELLSHGWILRRFSFSQLQDPTWRERINNELVSEVKEYVIEVNNRFQVKPNQIQREVLPELETKRSLGWSKGLVIMPTGTGKTYLAAMDSLAYFTKHPHSKILFVVHRNLILTQSEDAFKDIWPTGEAKFGMLNGERKENTRDFDVLFASKDTLSDESILTSYAKNAFDYIVIDEVHHGTAPTYQKIINYFEPKFFLGMTATPERLDRKDVLALFDYNKVCEYDINDAIEKGFLVSYEYHGLKDNVDYTNIKYNGKKYDLTDLEKSLIINSRNEMIFEKYMEYCHGDKAIGFCVSIRHAQAMAKLFNSKGIKSIAITSESPASEAETKERLTNAFKDDDYAVAFTVDMFNEGIDVPNVRGLLMLRPTESKTIFTQQIGRGLRLCVGKDKVIILDFIGNYKHANYIRQYLAKKVTQKTADGSNAFEKNIYEYNPKCKVEFEDDVQQILDMQDRQDHEINKDDLIKAYFDLEEELKRKPNKGDIDAKGEYRVSKYVSAFGGWLNFLREIGEITENGYHYPQGLHFGHILYILKSLHDKDYSGCLDPKFIKMRGDLSTNGDIATFQRQTKYKLQGMMGMGLITDDRKLGQSTALPTLSAKGEELYQILLPVINGSDLSFKDKDKGISWEMTARPMDFVEAIRTRLSKDQAARKKYAEMMFGFDAAAQMARFLYFDGRKMKMAKGICYSEFFKSKSVADYCEFEGIEIPTETGAQHRAPFLVSILETIGLLSTGTSDISLDEILFEKTVFNLSPSEEKEIKAWVDGGAEMDEILEERLKEMFGGAFYDEIMKSSVKKEVL